MRIQPWHILVLVVVILLVFGASRLPDIARNVGKSMKIMKEEVKDLREDDESATPSSDSGGQQASPQVSPPSTDAPGVPSPTTQYDPRSTDRNV